MHLPGARPVPIAATTAASTLVSGASLLYGWSFRETTGAAAAVVELYDGDGTDGLIVTTISLSSSESTRDWLGLPGIEIRTGLWYELVSGSVKGACWTSPGEFVDGFILPRGARPIP